MGVWKHECLWPKNKNGKKQEKVKGQESLRENSAFQKVCCQDHWTLLHLPPMPRNWSVFTDRIWAEPVHKDTEMETRMKTSICFQRPEKLERKKKKEQHRQMQNHFLFQHLWTYFPFNSQFRKQYFQKRMHTISRQAPQCMAMLPEAHYQLQSTVKLNEGDMYCHVLNTPLVTTTALLKLCCSFSLPNPIALTRMTTHHPTPIVLVSVGETLPKYGAWLLFFLLCGHTSLQNILISTLWVSFLNRLQYLFW